MDFEAMKAEQVALTEADLAAEEAAFESGFAGTDVSPVEEPTETPASTEEPGAPAVDTAAAADTKPDEGSQTKEPTIQDLLAQMEEIKADGARTRDRLYGKVGELQQRIDNARTQASGLSPRAKERLQTDFPELAEMLFDNDQTDPEPQTYTPPQSAAPQVVEIQEVIKREVEPLKLAVLHPDWEDIVASPQFDQFKTTLTPEEVTELDDSWDAKFIASKITQFKKWRADLAAQAAEDKKKKDRLNAAVLPKGVPKDGPAYSDDDEEAAMMSSFKKR